MVTALARFIEDDRGAILTPLLAPLALLTYLAQLHDPLALATLALAALPVVAKKGEKEEKLYMDLNLARRTRLFNPPRELKEADVPEYRFLSQEETSGSVKVEWREDPFTAEIKPAVKERIKTVGWRVDEAAVYLPAEFVELLKNLPFARLVLAGLVTLLLRQKPEERKGLFRRGEDGQLYLYMAEVETTLWGLCKVIGLTPTSGKNIKRVKEALLTLNQARYLNIEFYSRVVIEERRGKRTVKVVPEKAEGYTVLLPRVEFWEPLDEGKKRRKGTVRVLFCPELTAALLADTPKAHISLAALKATHKYNRGAWEAQNLVFYLSAVSANGKNQPLRLRAETLLEAACFQGRRDKGIRWLEKALTDLEAAGGIRTWEREGNIFQIWKLS